MLKYFVYCVMLYFISLVIAKIFLGYVQVLTMKLLLSQNIVIPLMQCINIKLHRSTLTYLNRCMYKRERKSITLLIFTYVINRYNFFLSEPPTAPRELRVFSAGSRAAQVSWALEGPVADSFLVQYLVDRKGR